MHIGSRLQIYPCKNEVTKDRKDSWCHIWGSELDFGLKCELLGFVLSSRIGELNQTAPVNLDRDDREVLQQPWKLVQKDTM